ncbi:MAG: ATP-binding protein [Pseudomonadota bacterium]
MPNIDKNMNRSVGRAMHKYSLLDAGDHIAVAVSGGKDSLSLLYILNEWKKKTPFEYRLSAIHIDLGFDGPGAVAIGEFCDNLGIPYRLEKTDYGIRAHGPENKENPCFLCSRLRRKRLFELAHKFGANKLALGHNKDDMIETLFLNIFYSGAISTMVPRQSLFTGLITVIRPLAFADAERIEAFARRLSFPEIENLCPSSNDSRRKEVREILQSLYRNNKKVKGNILHALSNVRRDYLL